jgi:hypothetical protein
MRSIGALFGWVRRHLLLGGAILGAVVVLVLGILLGEPLLTILGAATGLVGSVQPIREYLGRARPLVMVFSEAGGFGDLNSATRWQRASFDVEAVLRREIEARQQEGVSARLTAEEEKQFRLALSVYEDELRLWLYEVEAYCVAEREQVSMLLRFRNRGGTSVDQAEVTISLPPELSACDQAVFPRNPPRPPEPRPDANHLTYETPSQAVGGPAADPLPPEIFGPIPDLWDSEAGQLVRYKIPAILPHYFVDAKQDHRLNVRAPEPGNFRISWVLRARNATASGALTLSLAPDTADAAIIEGLADLNDFLMIHSQGLGWQESVSAAHPT